MMKTYINQESADNFILWLEHKLKSIPQLEPYYRSDNSHDLESMFLSTYSLSAYPLTICIAHKLPDGSVLIGKEAVFIFEQVGGRLKIGVKCHKSLAVYLLPILREMVEDFPETAKDLQPQINRIEREYDGITDLSSHIELNPWDKIEENYWDRGALKLWWSDYTCQEIGQMIKISARRVTNRISELRKTYGKEIVPFECDRRKSRHRVT